MIFESEERKIIPIKFIRFVKPFELGPNHRFNKQHKLVQLVRKFDTRHKHSNSYASFELVEQFESFDN